MLQNVLDNRYRNEF